MPEWLLALDGGLLLWLQEWVRHDLLTPLFTFYTHLGDHGLVWIALCLALFAFGSLVGWSYYGERTTEYLFGEGAVLLYKMAYVFVVSLGSVASLGLVWELADVCNGLMAIPNLTALFLLSRQVFAVRRDYERTTRGHKKFHLQ